MKNDEVKLALEWPISKVEKALIASSHDRLIAFIKDRYSERYFEPLKILNSPQEGPGFAVMSLCCLLVETFQAYRTGLPSSDRGELEKLSKSPIAPKLGKPYHIDASEFPNGNGEPFRCFFTSNARFFPGVDGGLFYKSIRNGLLHQSQTKDGWKIKIGRERLWDKNEKIVDRGLFVRHLHMYFNSYLEELEGLPPSDNIVAKAKRKIWWLCQLSK
ncbi:MAG: hypothetical protein WBE86_12895 [Candidatus Acidiferrales bacterium]